MKVLLVTGSYPPLRCGVGDYSYRLASALSDQPSVGVTVLTSTGATAGPGKATLLPLMKTWGLLEAFTFFGVVRRLMPDVVHVQYPTQGYRDKVLPFMIPFMAWLSGAKVVQTWHEPISKPGLLLRCGAPSAIVVVRHGYLGLLRPLARTLVGRRKLHYITGGPTLPIARLAPLDRAALRQTYLRGQHRLLVFFGFVLRQKGVDLLFDIGDPQVDHIVIAGDASLEPDFMRHLESLASGRWAGKSTFTGYLSPMDAVSLLAVADAVVLPFRDGSGSWNSSIHSAVENGAYVVTTTTGPSSYDSSRNVAKAQVDDIGEMRAAVSACSQRQRCISPEEPSSWGEIAKQHLMIYASPRS